jgi:hypothetical protein
MVMNTAGDELSLEAKDLEEDLNPLPARFYNLLRDADKPLLDGCKKHTKLSAVTQLFNLTSDFFMSESCYERMIVIIKSMLPDSKRLPNNFYRSKRMVRELGLEYQKIDAYPNYCQLYYKEYNEKKI